MKKYYKVVQFNLTSADVAPGELERKCVQYKIGEWVEAPDNTRLFVFDSLYEAREFAGSFKRVFECQVIGVSKDRYFGVAHYDVKTFWTKFNNFIQRKQKPKEEVYENLYRYNTPAILVKKVKLVKQV